MLKKPRRNLLLATSQNGALLHDDTEKENALAPKAEVDCKYHRNALGMLTDKDNSEEQRWIFRIGREVLVKLSMLQRVEWKMLLIGRKFFFISVLKLSAGVGSSCTCRTRQTVESLSWHPCLQGLVKSGSAEDRFPSGYYLCIPAQPADSDSAVVASRNRGSAHPSPDRCWIEKWK